MITLNDVQRGYDAWAAKPHNAKWVRKIDGTPIANDIIVNIFEALKDTPQEADPAVVLTGGEAVAWRCFHCDEVFTDKHSAGLHFGMDQCSDPACKIKMGAEGSLVVALRRVEKELDDAMFAIHNESTEAAKAYHSQQYRHQEQLRATEELGYERGLADGRTLPGEELLAALKPFADLADEIPAENFWPSKDMAIINRAREVYLRSAALSIPSKDLQHTEGER